MKPRLARILFVLRLVFGKVIGYEAYDLFRIEPALKSFRPDLDGQRLTNQEGTHVWLMFNGMRHHVTSSAVFDALFRPDLSMTSEHDVASIIEGPDLGTGTRLVSHDETGEIFLVFGAPAVNIRKHLIENYENFVALGFSDALVRAVPPILLAAIPSGRSIRF